MCVLQVEGRVAVVPSNEVEDYNRIGDAGFGV